MKGLGCLVLCVVAVGFGVLLEGSSLGVWVGCVCLLVGLLIVAWRCLVVLGLWNGIRLSMINAVAKAVSE